MKSYLTRTVVAALALAVSAVGAMPATAAPCALDNPPAATLLLPYFEVDLDHPGGLTTLFSINNASATAVLANVVLWTDLGIPTLSFPLYLTGYDLQTINMRDVFAGTLPSTATAGQDPTDSISPHGHLSQDINFASCHDFFPLQPLDPGTASDLRAAHTGFRSGTSQLCSAQQLGDHHARGYVTVDTVNECSATRRSPLDAGYFAAGSAGRATNQNILWGDFFLVDPDQNSAEGDNLVRVEAPPGLFHDGDVTFYGRFVGYSGIDNREPLAANWSTRYATGHSAFDGGTQVVVWRDPESASNPWNCRGPLLQPWYPLGQAGLVVFDEQENPEVPVGCGFECPPVPSLIPFPAATNKISIGGPVLPVPFDFGWIAFDLGQPPLGGPAGRSQAWMVTLMSASGRFAVGFAANPLDTACHPRHCLPGQGDCS